MRLKFDDWSDESEYSWDVHFTMPRSIERIEVNYTINPTDGTIVNNIINQVGG